MGQEKAFYAGEKTYVYIKVQREVIKNVLFGVYRSWGEQVTRDEVRKVNRIQICGALQAFRLCSRWNGKPLTGFPAEK